MKILLQYLKPYKWLVALTLLLAAINTSFSLIDPIIFGKIINLAKDFENNASHYPAFVTFGKAVAMLLLMSIGVAMVSRIAKNFQDYFMNVIQQKFGAKVFTDGLRHAMKLPYQDFEDQRSGETLSTLTKVRTDTERFISSFVNVLFAVIVGILFVFIYSFRIHWSLPLVYFAGIIIITWATSVLSRKIKSIQ